MAINGDKFSQSYLNEINDVMTNRMDGDKDGKVTVQEALKDLNIGSLLSGLKEGSAEYNKLKNLTDNIPEVLKNMLVVMEFFKIKNWLNF